MLRILLDTNVIVSAIVKGGAPRKIWLAFKEEQISLIFSISMLEEPQRVLRRPKFANIINEEELKKILLFIELFAEFTELCPKEISICRDPADNHILLTADSGRADFIVTGDKDLLVLKTFRRIPIITPRKLLKILGDK